jgi:hypothetical protein
MWYTASPHAFSQMSEESHEFINLRSLIAKIRGNPVTVNVQITFTIRIIGIKDESERMTEHYVTTFLILSSINLLSSRCVVLSMPRLESILLASYYCYHYHM